MIDERLAEFAEYAKKKVLAAKASDAVISVERTSGNRIKFVNNEVVKTSVTNNEVLSIFAVLGKKIALTSVKKLNKEDIAKTIDKLSKFARNLMPKRDYFGIADGPFRYKKVPDLFDKKIPVLSASRIVDYVETGVNAALEQGASRASGVFNIGHTDTYLTTSRNVVAKDEESSAYFSIRALVGEEASGHNTTAACMLKDLDVFKTGVSAGEIARLSKNPVLGKGGTYDVIFAPMAFAPLLGITGDAASIFSVETGFSFLQNKIGKKVGSSKVTILDYGNLQGGFGATPFDDEGTPTQKTTLIDKGVLKTYLYNASFARKYKTKSTGNAGLISPGAWQVVLKPGKFSKDSLFKDVKRGIYITNVWYTRFRNYLSGDFSTIPRDGMFLIKNGEIKKPIKRLRVSDNIIRILQNVSRVANDSRQVWSWELGESGSPVTMPHVLVKNVRLTQPTA